jgi:cation:H+ antiporter
LAFHSLILFVGGLVALIVGAEGLVRGASRLAATLGTPPLIIGLTVVAFGTSSPELVVSVQAALSGQPAIALGNVVGSNIFNVLFILGLSALAAPLIVSEQVVRHDVPIMIGVSSLVMLLATDNMLGRVEGLFLVALLFLYLLFLAWIERMRRRPTAEHPAEPRPHLGLRTVLVDGAYIMAGLALLVLGSRWLVASASDLARLLGLSELVIGLTIVAAGTSLPEVATSVTASVRGERDIAVGNVVGSNIFNLLMVLGATSAISPTGIAVPPAALTFDMPVMIAVAIACLPVFFAGFKISRWEGAVFVAYYVAYVIFLALDASNHAAAPIFSLIMLSFVVPITALTFTIVFIRQRSRSAAARSSPPPVR